MKVETVSKEIVPRKGFTPQFQSKFSPERNHFQGRCHQHACVNDDPRLAALSFRRQR